MSVFINKYLLDTVVDLQFTSFITRSSFHCKLPKVFNHSSLPKWNSLGTTRRSRFSFLSLWTDHIIQWLSRFRVTDVRSQSLILCKLEIDLSLVAYVVITTCKIFNRIITWERYSRQFTENVFSVFIISLIECFVLKITGKIKWFKLGS